MKKIKFCNHAKAKFELLKAHGFPINKKQVTETIKSPDKTERGKKGRMVAQRVLDNDHVLRVIYEKADFITVITFYPGRRSYYEN